MKKIVSIILVLATALSMGTMAFADGTTTLTTTVPNAKYTLNIPANQEIEFNAESTEIGNVTVSESSGFADGKNLQVTISYGAFTSNEVSTTIPFFLRAYYPNPSTTTQGGDKSQDITSGGILTFLGKSSGVVSEKAIHPDISYEMTKLIAKIAKEDWGKALAGDYTAIITFTSEVVVEE